MLTLGCSVAFYSEIDSAYSRAILEQSTQQCAKGTCFYLMLRFAWAFYKERRDKLEKMANRILLRLGFQPIEERQPSSQDAVESG